MRGPGIRQSTVVMMPHDYDIIDAVREEHGLSLNAAVRYCIRAQWAQMAEGQEKRRRTVELKNWLAETKAHLRPGRREK